MRRPVQIPGQEVRKALERGLHREPRARLPRRAAPARARLGRRGTFAGNPAAHPREHLSQNSHHHLAHRVIHSVSGAHPGPWEASRADRPGDFRNIGGGQKTANPAGHGRDLARHFFQHFANSFIHKISTAVRRSTAGRSLPAKPRVGRIPGAAPAARFRHSLPTAFPQETRGTGMPVKMSPGLPFRRHDAHEYWVFRLSRKVRGDRRKHARRRHGWIRCPQFRDAPSWRIPQRLSLALSPTGRNPAAPSNAFPTTAEGIFSTGNANSFSTDKPTEAPVADRAFRKADSRCRNAFRGSPAGSQMGTSRNGSCNLSTRALHTDLSTACAQCIMAEARSRAKDGIFPSISRTKEAKAPFRQQRR